jgi:hypothetical protein
MNDPSSTFALRAVSAFGRAKNMKNSAGNTSVLTT